MIEQYQRQLIKDSKAGNNYALAQLLQENYAIIYKYLVKLTLNSDLAEDITQDCMIRAINKIASYDEEKSSFSTWMITIAKHLWVDECRKKKRLNQYLDKCGKVSDLNTVDDITENNTILSAIKALSLKIRMPILLKYSEGYSYEEIAKILKIPIGTVKSRIYNGTSILRKELINDEK